MVPQWQLKALLVEKERARDSLKVERRGNQHHVETTQYAQTFNSAIKTLAVPLFSTALRAQCTYRAFAHELNFAISVSDYDRHAFTCTATIKEDLLKNRAYIT